MQDGAPAHCSTKVQAVVRIEPAAVLKELTGYHPDPNPERGSLGYLPAGHRQMEFGGQPRRLAVTAKRAYLVENQAVCAVCCISWLPARQKMFVR